MKEQKYTIIKSDDQYYEYCSILEHLVSASRKENENNIKLLTLLIEKYDEEKMISKDIDPIELIKLFMKEHKMIDRDLAMILDVNKSTVSRMMNYQKALSKNSIRILANHFAISQEALNRPYQLKNKVRIKFKNRSLMATKKENESNGYDS